MLSFSHKFLVAPSLQMELLVAIIQSACASNVKKGGFAPPTPHACWRDVRLGAPFDRTPTALQGQPPAPPLNNVNCNGESTQ